MPPPLTAGAPATRAASDAAAPADTTVTPADALPAADARSLTTLKLVWAGTFAVYLDHTLPVLTMTIGKTPPATLGADQVRRLRDLRGRVQRRDLPGHQPLDLRWRMAAGERRDAGLRRIDGGAPDRCDRSPRRPTVAGTADRQVRARRQAAGDPGALDAARRPRRPDPVAGLVRVQPRIHAGRDRQPLRRGGAGHQPRRSGGSAGSLSPRSTRCRRRSTSAWRATARSQDWSRSPLRRATSSSGPHRSSALSQA